MGVENEDLSEEATARQFFGFSPQGRVDGLLLRSRKFDKDRKARSQEEKDLIQTYFDVLAPQAGIRPASKAAPAEEGDAPRRCQASGIQIAGDPLPSPRVQGTLARLRSQLDHAINAAVISSTIAVYRNLFGTMAELASYLGVEPLTVPNTAVRKMMFSPDPQVLSRGQLREVLDLLPEDLHTSLGGTPEFNHPAGQYAPSPESKSGLLFGYLISAIRDKVMDRWQQLNAGE
jgi:hypothetical protein